MAQQITIDIVAETRRLQAGIDDANKRLSGIQSATTNVQNLSSAFVGVGVAAAGFSTATNFISNTTDATSDLAEATSKNQVIFGDVADEIEAFSAAAAKGLGQSQVQALNAASTFATFGKGAGLAGEDLVDFSTEFVTLASDLASFNNTTPEDAITAIGAALRGESEPIRRYGVLLNDAALRQEALEQGIYDGEGALSAQQKVLAAGALILKQTTDAQGDFERTSDGLANSTRILEAEQANLNTQIGEIFLPIMKELVNIGKQVIGFFTSLPKPVQNTLIVVGVLAATLGPLILLVASLITAFKTIGSVLGGFGSIAKVAAGAMKLLSASFLTNPIFLVIAAITALVAGLIYFFSQTELGKELWAGFVGFLQDTMENVGKFITDTLTNIGNFFTDTFENIGKFLDTTLTAIGKFFTDTFENIKKVVKTAIDIVKKVIETVFNAIKAYFEFVFNLYKTIFTTAFNIIKGIVETVVNAIKAVIETVFKAIEWFIKTFLRGLEVIFGGAFQIIKDIVTGAWNFINEKTNGALTKLRDTIGNIWSSIKDRIKGFIDNIINFFGGIPEAMANVGKNIVEGIWNGISGLTTWFRDKVLGFFGNLLPGWVKDALGINSPSKVFQELGQNIAQGTAAGLTVPSLNTRALGIAGQSGVNITINAGLGTDPYQLGRQVTKALSNYSRVTRV